VEGSAQREQKRRKILMSQAVPGGKGKRYVTQNWIEGAEVFHWPKLNIVRDNTIIIALLVMDIVEKNCKTSERKRSKEVKG